MRGRHHDEANDALQLWHQLDEYGKAHTQAQAAQPGEQKGFQHQQWRSGQGHPAKNSAHSKNRCADDEHGDAFKHGADQGNIRRTYLAIGKQCRVGVYGVLDLRHRAFERHEHQHADGNPQRRFYATDMPHADDGKDQNQPEDINHWLQHDPAPRKPGAEHSDQCLS